MICGRGEGALLAWKLDSRGTVIDEVVVLDDVIGGNVGVYRIERGKETINTRQNNNTNTIHGKRRVGGELMRCYVLQTKRKLNRQFYRLRIITG